MSHWEREITEIIEQAQALKAGYAQTWSENIKKYAKVCIFGAGEHGIAWYHILKGWDMAIDYFCDNNESKWNREVVDGIKCYAPEKCKEEKAQTAVIIAVKNYKPIFEQICEPDGQNVFVASINRIGYTTNYEYIGNSFKLQELREKMLKLIQLCDDETSKEICCQTLRKWLLDEKEEIAFHGDSYFYTEYLKLSEQECLVDGGAFDGDTIRSFKAATKDRFDRIYAFEMDKKNFEALKHQLGSDERIEFYQIGLSDQKATGYYDSNFCSTVLAMEGTEKCETDCLDHVLKNKKVTMIKMDIEGSEQRALKGAEQIIQEQKPKLAICIYHSMDDFLEIPVYLKELNSDYKIFIRHHSTNESETVCYAY